MQPDVIHMPARRDYDGPHHPRDQRHVESTGPGHLVWWWERVGPCDEAKRTEMLKEKRYDV